MTKYEYQIERMAVLDSDGAEVSELYPWLNEHGHEGWELVGIQLETKTGWNLFIFKRELR